MKSAVNRNSFILIIILIFIGCSADSNQISDFKIVSSDELKENILTFDPSPIASADVFLNEFKEKINTSDESIEIYEVESTIPDYMKNVWLCTDDRISTFDDLTTDTSENFKCSASVSYDAKYAIVKSNGIPNHDFESGLGCCAGEQNYEWKIPLQPEVADVIEYVPDRGPIAISVNGVPFFGPEEGPGGDAVALHFEYFEEDRQPIVLGLCGGHSAGDVFHYHYDGNCVHWHPEDDGKSWIDWGSDLLNSKEVSPVIGFSFDGYPIYGPYGFDNSGEVREMLSSYRLKEGKNGYGGIDDWEYVEGLGDLDQCNGIKSEKPNVNGTSIYQYHASKNSGSGEIGFPYFILCYSGVVEESNFSQVQQNQQGMGLPDGQQDQQGGMMRPPIPTCKPETPPPGRDAFPPEWLNLPSCAP